MNVGLVLALALALDGWAGEPRWLWSRIPHPAVWMGKAVSALDNRLNTGTSVHAKGVAAVAILVAASGIVGVMIGQIGWLAELLCAAVLLAQKSLVQHVGAVATGLRNSLQSGRHAVAMIVSRDTRDMDEPAVARAAIESAAENLSDGVVAPALWFLVAGLPGLLIYKIVNTADSMIGYRNEKYAEFGWAAAKLDDVLNLAPARLTAFAIAGLAGGLHRWPDIAADARRHNSPNAGWPEAAMARALNVALAGPRSYDGRVRDLEWVHEDGEHDIGPAHIDATVAMLWRVWRALVIAALLVASLAALPILG